MLLNSQRNRLFQILSGSGLQPSDFKESMAGGWYRLELRNKPSSIYFHILRVKEDKEEIYQTTRRPGSSSTPDNKEISSYRAWDSSYTYSCTEEFSRWAASVKLEVDSPDLWAENAKALQLFSSSNSLASEGFSVSELGAVQGQLRMLVQNFEVSDLPDSVKERLIMIARTALLKADNFNKKDWQNWIAGAFANAVSSLGLDGKQIQEVVALVRQAFGGLFLQE
jgi:hypothetical protein